MRWALLFALPLAAKFGAMGPVEDIVVVGLGVLSLLAAVLDCAASDSAASKRNSLLSFVLICIFLYCTQVGVVIHTRFALFEAHHAQHDALLTGKTFSHEAAVLSASLKQQVAQAPETPVEHATLHEPPGQPQPQEEEPKKKPLLSKGAKKKKKHKHVDTHVAVPPARVGEIEEEGYGGVIRKTDPPKTISIVLPCAEERTNAVNTVGRFCERTPDDQLAEIIAVDDGSNPPLITWFEKDKRRLDQNPKCKLKILRHEMTTGLMAAKQTGGKAAVGDVIAFFDCHCSPKPDWQVEIFQQVAINPRRMVVPAITDLNMDNFEEKEDSQVNAKCYLTFDADFKWYDDASPFIPTISGGLVAMGREWFNITGGFDEMMHGWGGENLDQSLRAWLCGGDIVRALSSRVAHMWRTGDPRTGSHSHLQAKATNNRGRVAAAWFDAFLPAYRGGSVNQEEVSNYDAVKKRLGCRHFSYFLYRFRKVYIEAGVIATSIFNLREKASGLCVSKSGGTVRPVACDEKGKGQRLQRGNVDLKTGKCCSGIRAYGSNDCWDYFDGKGAHWYSCDVSGQNGNQQYRMTEDGHIERSNRECVFISGQSLQKKPCEDLQGDEGVWERVHEEESSEFKLYKEEVAKYNYAELMPDLPDD